ncbi:hypothetical protein DSO57_1012006 [Entomophthora muscae]|uniref:Uncharacterized protein n=1 Tax=Entomophthora muscae TaxID=34485 RepID=A0ACC2UFP1_9FUNG|nr:hypothetical protein DSO57_1012006 [Entomophthora muscae]
MLYLRPEAACYKGLSLVTIYKLKDNESQLTTDAGNVFQQTETGKKTPYIPTIQCGDTILHYHCTLGHIRGCNLFKIMKHKSCVGFLSASPQSVSWVIARDQLGGVGIVRIDNSSSLESWAWEQELNPDPRSPQASGPLDQRIACPHFSGIEPPEADAKNVGPCSKTGQTKEIISPNGRPIAATNRGTEVATISFMNLKSTPVANQELSPGRGMGLRPNPMTTTLKQVNQVANSRFLTNERTPGPSAILLHFDPSTQPPWACLSQCPYKPPWKVLSLEVGCYIDQRTPHSKLIAIFE